MSCLSQIRVRFVPDCSRFVPVLFPICVRFGSCVCISLTCVVLYFICTSFVRFGSPCPLFVLVFCRFVALFSSSFARFCHCICAVHSSPVLALLSSCFDSCFRACCHASNCVVMLCFHWSIRRLSFAAIRWQKLCVFKSLHVVKM